MLYGETIHIRIFNTNDVEAMLKLQRDNREFFEGFLMDRSDEFYTADGQLNRILKFEENRKSDESYVFGIFKNDDKRLIGSINLFQVMRGSLQGAFIGYHVGKNYNGKGYATEAAKLIVSYGFNELKLHRIEAGVMPRNIGSIRVLEKSGFHKEGIAKKNVKINGKWEDHQVLAIINPED